MSISFRASLRRLILIFLNAIECIILKCLAKDPALRYQSISELKQDLEGAAKDPQGYVIAAAVKRSESALRISDSEPSEQNVQPVRKHKNEDKAEPDNKKQLHKKLIFAYYRRSIVPGRFNCRRGTDNSKPS